VPVQSSALLMENGKDEKQRRVDVPAPRVLNREQYLSKMQEVVKPMVQIGAMYNSLIDGIVTDPELMTIPIHDHAVVRGHAVFDTCTAANGRLYRLDAHLDRHLASAQRARIPLPFGPSPDENRSRMFTAVAQTVIASGWRNCSVRYFTSAGPGNFAVLPSECTSAFYVVVWAKADEPMEPAVFPGIEEVTVDVPLKPSILATTKSNNYMLNVLTSMTAKDQGGNFGILVDPDGNLAESCVMNCAFVTQDQRLITPTFDQILAGTTCKKILQLAPQLVKEGLLTAVSQEKVPVSVARDCVEMMLFAGDTHIWPILKWDGKPVGKGEVGPIANRLGTLLKQEVVEGTDDHYELTYIE